jgi:hypothetical protein
MLKMFYKQSKANPWLFFKQNQEKELSIWILWVDDLLTVGKSSVVKNAVCELSRGMTQATEEAYTAMQQVMPYCVATPNRGLFLAPEGQWNGHKDEQLVIKGMSDTT